MANLAHLFSTYPVQFMHIIKYIAIVAKRMPKLILRIRYFKSKFRYLNFNSPKDYYGMVLVSSWENRNNHFWASLADKLQVREYVASTIGDKYLIPLYGAYKAPSDIDFEKMPQSFVLKTNNSCGTNIIVKDKNLISPESIRQQLHKSLNFPFGELTGQLHYSLISPCIIAEEYMKQDGNSSSLVDYKFYCTNGIPRVVMVFSNRTAKFTFKTEAYDMDWKPADRFLNKLYINPARTDKPPCFEEMKQIVRKLAAPHKYVRIDLYVINGHVYFGEITLTPGMHDKIYVQKWMDTLLY